MALNLEEQITRMLELADEHGDEEGNEAHIGDLEVMCRLFWSLMRDDQRLAAIASKEMEDLREAWGLSGCEPTPLERLGISLGRAVGHLSAPECLDEPEGWRHIKEDLEDALALVDAQLERPRRPKETKSDG